MYAYIHRSVLILIQQMNVFHLKFFNPFIKSLLKLRNMSIVFILFMISVQRLG